MNEKKMKLIVGSLLHDIGKVIYRTGEKNDHSSGGYNFLKKEIRLDEKISGGEEILDCVRYHHANKMKNASISEDSIAYITYIADNIASAVDRRADDDPEPGFDKITPLKSIFNKFNKGKDNFYYPPGMLDSNNKALYPTEKKEIFSSSIYSSIKSKIAESLNAIKLDEAYITSLLNIMEATLSYIPSSTSKEEVADISLYDHVKITAAAAACISDYLDEKGINNYREVLYRNSKKFYKEKAFLMYSMDISGIQKFIYEASGEDALKMLRARSFYLEIFMENIIDDLLSELNLSRANLIYCGGGHMYMLLPNTKAVKDYLHEYEKKVNDWLLERYKTSIFVACGYSECSAESFQNKPKGSYKDIYSEIGRIISDKKRCRYGAEDIIKLNSAEFKYNERECRICKTVDNVNEDKLCSICEGFVKLSKGILDSESLFVIISEYEDGAVPIMKDRWIKAEKEENLRKRISENRSTFVRVYTKNGFYTGDKVATTLWVGEYTKGNQKMERFATVTDGIERVGILRMDVDNLGQAFVAGFSNEENDDRYVTLSRTAAFSRQMTVFFKYNINYILNKPEFCKIRGEEAKKEGRNATIVYSGGDDVMLVGAWDDVIEAAEDIRENFKSFTQNKLTISAGIGIYSPAYPIHIMADEAGSLEDASKHIDENKNAVTLFDKKYSFKWDCFRDVVMGEKYRVISTFFDNSEERGKGFLYNLLELIRNREEKINLARFAYTLSRLEPKESASNEEKQNYNEFKEIMFSWRLNGTEEDFKELEMAMYLYVYHKRKEEK